MIISRNARSILTLGTIIATLYTQSGVYKNLKLAMNMSHVQRHRTKEYPTAQFSVWSNMEKIMDLFPNQLKFFVRASQPITMNEALRGARMGEAVEYCQPYIT